MGLGGGNFSSSMANISFFYPEGKKGLALGLNAAGGNLGVAVTQLHRAARDHHRHRRSNLAYAGADLDAVHRARDGLRVVLHGQPHPGQAGRQSYRLALSNKHTWVMSFLYIGTFGSFIGFSFALPVAHQDSVSGGRSSSCRRRSAFLGALIGSVARPFGGWLSDRIGGARVTLRDVRRPGGRHRRS